MKSRALWLFIELALIAGLVLAAIYYGLSGVILGSVILVAVSLPSIARRLARSRVTVKAFQNFGYRDVKCPYCTGGAQLLGKNGWGKIPVQVRVVQDGAEVFHPKLANVRSCNECGGKGFKPVKVIKGHTRRERIAWPPGDGRLMSGEKVYKEKPDA